MMCQPWPQIWLAVRDVGLEGKVLGWSSEVIRIQTLVLFREKMRQRD